MTINQDAVDILEKAQKWMVAGAGRPSLATFGYGSIDGAAAVRIAMKVAGDAGYYTVEGREGALGALEQAIKTLRGEG